MHASCTCPCLCKHMHANGPKQCPGRNSQHFLSLCWSKSALKSFNSLPISLVSHPMWGLSWCMLNNMWGLVRFCRDACTEIRLNSFYRDTLLLWRTVWGLCAKKTSHCTCPCSHRSFANMKMMQKKNIISWHLFKHRGYIYISNATSVLPSESSKDCGKTSPDDQEDHSGKQIQVPWRC